MKMWVQIRGHDDDDEYPDTAVYEILAGGVLKVANGNDVHLYSPGHWEEVLIDTRPEAERDQGVQQLDDDIKWQ